VQIADFAGAHGAARIPVSRVALNRLIADALAGRSLPVKSVDVRPLAGDRFEARIAVTWPFVPALTMSFAIVEQPSFPTSPILVLRWSMLGSVGAFAGKLISSFDRMPKGVRLDDDRLRLDLAALAAGSPAAPFVGYIKTLELHTLEDAAVIDVELSVPA
jgi:hypothetical protein